MVWCIGSKRLFRHGRRLTGQKAVAVKRLRTLECILNWNFHQSMSFNLTLPRAMQPSRAVLKGVASGPGHHSVHRSVALWELFSPPLAVSSSSFRRMLQVVGLATVLTCGMCSVLGAVSLKSYQYMRSD